MTALQFPPLWQAFDPDWYRQEYKTVLGEAAALSDADLKTWYEEQGAFSGHSPNRFLMRNGTAGTAPKLWQTLRPTAAVPDLSIIAAPDSKHSLRIICSRNAIIRPALRT